jgi:hypothetical protein
VNKFKDCDHDVLSDLDPTRCGGCGLLVAPTGKIGAAVDALDSMRIAINSSLRKPKRTVGETLPYQLPRRRKRSHLSRQDCLVVLESFARKVYRFGESSSASMFQEGRDDPNLPPDQINVQFAVFGSYGVAADLFEAVRVLAGYKLPRVGK